MKMIDSFQGENRWLSNFWPCTVIFEGEEYKSVEAAFVSAKTTDLNARKIIQNMENPGDVKRFGRSLKLRDDWENIKLNIMYKLLQQKFSKNSILGKKLEATGQQELVENNTWNDTFWGVCNGKGQNNLGKLLMQVRKELYNS